MSLAGHQGVARPPLRVPRGYFRKADAPFWLAQISPPEASDACEARAG